MSDKKYTPKEAAMMVLAKAQELYKTSTLAKGEWAKIHSKLKREGYSEESADKIDGSIKAKMEKGELKKDFPVITNVPKPVPPPVAAGISGAFKSEEMSKSDESGANPDQAADAQLGEQVEQDVQQHEEQNADPAHEAPMKGHIKLAKFMGRMEHKKGQKAKEMSSPKIDKAY